MPFDAFEIALALIRSLRRPLAKIAQHDKSLADQIREAVASAALNLCEGQCRTGRDQAHLWRIAHGSAQETLGGARVAEAFGYVGPEDLAESLALADRLLAMCWRLTHR